MGSLGDSPEALRHGDGVCVEKLALTEPAGHRWIGIGGLAGQDVQTSYG
jgi:hypothetical protein